MSTTTYTTETSRADADLVVEGNRFALVPEWVIDAKIPDSSLRLYALLLRYGGSSGHRMPSRATLARRMRRSVDAVDRALKELVAAGIVVVEHRRDGDRFLSNRYHVRTSAPVAVPPPGGGGRKTAATPAEGVPERTAEAPPESVGSRTSAATPGRESAATPGRRSAARVAANLRPNREFFTQSKTPPPPTSSEPAPPSQTEEAEEAEDALLENCGIGDLVEFAGRVRSARTALGKPVTRWTDRAVEAALRSAVCDRGWPARLAASAMLAIAADPATGSPMRLGEAGPWWDEIGSAVGGSADEPEQLDAMEAVLAEVGGRRLALQAQARRELAAEGMPVTRSTVLRRACELLELAVTEDRPETNAYTAA